MQPSIAQPNAADSEHAVKRSRKGIALACAALLLAGLFTLAIAPARSAEAPLPRVSGSLPRYGADAAKALGVADLVKSSDHKSGLAIINPKLDRLYQLYNLDDADAGIERSLGVVERDLATLAVTRAKVIPGHTAEIANSTYGAEWVGSLDTKNDNLYLAYKPSGGLNGTPGAFTDNNLPGLLVLNLRDFSHVDSTFPNFLAGLGDKALNLVGIEFDEGSDTLLILQAAVEGTSSLANSLTLVGWKAADILKGGALPQVTPRPIRACRRDPLNDAANPFLTPILIADAPDVDGDGKVKPFVMVPCYSTTFSTNVVIARMERASALDPQSSQEKAVVSPAGVTSWALDSAHGRMYLVNNSAETDAWVYEAATNAFVGIIALSPKGSLEASAISLGVDEVSGRLYGRAQSYGLMIAAAAQDPVPQADVYPRLSAVGAFRLLVDPKRNRVFSLPGSSNETDVITPAYQIIDVPPALPAPPREDPDSRTAQVDEVPGTTQTQYGGNASAYGLRVLLASGIGGAIPSNGNQEVGLLYRNANSYCGFTDREMVLARVSKTELSNTSRFARAASMDPDNSTIVDLSAPSRCDIYNSYQGASYPIAGALLPFLNSPGVLQDADRNTPENDYVDPPSTVINEALGPRTRWDYKPADCSTEDGKDEAGPNTRDLTGKTSVDCDGDNSISAKAESRVRQADASDMTVSVARATASTKVYKDPERGLVSTATSRLEGVKIGDISIGYISNTATSYAKGRKDSAKTEWEKPKIGYVDGVGVPSCTDQCDVGAVIKALNSALAGRVEFRTVAPEQRLAAGSPGGYEAGILKSEKQIASDNSLSGDRSVEIPAMEMVVYNDNTSVGRARQVYQFAGVRVDSHYGIQVVGDGCSTCGGGINDVLDPMTGDVDPGIIPSDGVASAPNFPEATENIIKRFVRQSAAGANYSLRIIFSNPQEALLMATVWVLIWGPFVASRRRRALKAVATADPEGML